MFDVVIIGGGPAGIGVLSCLYRLSLSASAPPLKLCMVEALATDKAGRLAHYNISSDTRAEKFLSCLEGLPETILQDAKFSALIESIKNYGAGAMPLHLAGKFYRRLGILLQRDMQCNGQLELHSHTQALKAVWQDSHWEINTRSMEGENTIKSQHIVMACGASEAKDRIDMVLHSYGLCCASIKAFQLSSNLLKSDTHNPTFEHLRTLRAPKVIIIGGSHSAISTAGKLLLENIVFRSGGIEILHRSEMQATFETPEDAKNAGLTAFDANDICPITGRVFALKGFRLDARDLFMSVKGYNGNKAEKRVKLTAIETLSRDNVKRILKSADLVISALGYDPDYIPIYPAQNSPSYDLHAARYVNQNSQLLAANGRAIPNCYALGLATNYDLSGRFGEPSFTGQANGLVLWHKDIGMDIAASLIESCT